MSAEFPARSIDAAPLGARALDADQRTATWLSHAADDLMTPDVLRLDDRTRASVIELLSGMVAAVARELAVALDRSGGQATELPSVERLVREMLRAGLLRGGGLAAELIGRVGQERLAQTLPRAASESERPSLFTRLLTCPDDLVSAGARALLIADNRRRSVLHATELPAELHHRLVWWTAAALQAHFERAGGVFSPAIIAAAVRTSLAVYDEGERLEAIAMRLGAAIDARADELPSLLLDALDDGRPALFIAALARAGRLAYDDARTILLEPSGERLWLLLRSLGLERAAIARIAYLLAEADPVRDIEAFADRLDAIVAVTPDDAAEALSSLRLDPVYREARRALIRVVEERWA